MDPSLTFCQSLAAVSVNPVIAYSLTMNVALTGKCPNGWGCSVVLLLSFVARSKWQVCFICCTVNHQDILLFTLLTFPGISPS